MVESIESLTRDIDARAYQEGHSSKSAESAARSAFHAHLTFTGTGPEYFRIWVVHALLTVLSLGIYSAWAKARKARWFAQHTQLLGDSFDYHGRPRRILLGRLIALALLIAYSRSFEWSRTAGLTVIGLLVVLGPALYGAAQRFRMTNTSWRGLRFSFDAPLRTVYAVCIPVVLVWTAGTVWSGLNGSPKGVWAVTALSGLAWPFVHASLKSLQHSRTRFGEQRFAFRPAMGAFYALYARTVGVGFAALLLLGAGAGAVRELLSQASPANQFIGGVIIGITLIGLTYVIAGCYFLARLQRLVWSHTTLGHLQFGSTIEASVLVGLVARRLLLVVVTAGLYWPFAAVAIARYRVQSITVEGDGPPPEFAGKMQASATAVGDAAFDLFGLDLGW